MSLEVDPFNAGWLKGDVLIFGIEGRGTIIIQTETELRVKKKVDHTHQTPCAGPYTAPQPNHPLREQGLRVPV